MRGRALFPLVGMAAVQLIGCGEDGSSDGAHEAPQWSVEEVVRIGSMDEPGISFSNISDVLALDSGLFVLEQRPPRLARFDASGQWLGDVAGPGDGPGELRGPTEIGYTEGILWIGDRPGARLEMYGPDGESEGSFRFSIPADSFGTMSVPQALLADGTVLAGPGLQSVGGQLRGTLRYLEYWKVNRDGSVIRRIYRAELASDDMFEASLGGERRIMGAHPVRHSPLVAAFPDGSGLVVVERPLARESGSDTFRLKVFDVEGMGIVDRAVPYVPVPAVGWLEDHIADVRERSPEPVPAALVDALREGLAEREFYPPVSQLVAGIDGTIWLRREPTDSITSTWDVWSREGERIGRVNLPGTVGVGQASASEIWGIERDELGVPFVIGYHIRR